MLHLTPSYLAWIRRDHPTLWESKGIVDRCRMLFQSSLNGYSLGASRLKISGLARKRDERRHVFILGCWRSGTTAMHELLHNSGHFTTPLTRHCMRAHQLLLVNGVASVGALARPMDGMLISDTSPQEDEFALMTYGIESAYRCFSAPGTLSQLHHTLSPAYWADKLDWTRELDFFLDGVMGDTHGQETTPILLKSPNHTFRIRSLVSSYPRAKIIFMRRPDDELLSSNTKMWTQMMDLHGQFGAATADELASFLEVAVANTHEVHQWLWERQDCIDVIDVHMRDLRTDPAGTLRNVLEWLGPDYRSQRV